MDMNLNATFIGIAKETVSCLLGLSCLQI